MTDLLAGIDFVAAASIVTACVATIGLILAWRQISVSREVAAQTAYEAYHHLAILHPALGAGQIDFNSVAEEDRERYRWFVLSMLLTVERILALFPNDRYWRAALEDDIRIHKTFISSESFASHLGSLDPSVIRLIQSVLNKNDKATR